MLRPVPFFASFTSGSARNNPVMAFRQSSGARGLGRREEPPASSAHRWPRGNNASGYRLGFARRFERCYPSNLCRRYPWADKAQGTLAFRPASGDESDSRPSQALADELRRGCRNAASCPVPAMRPARHRHWRPVAHGQRVWQDPSVRAEPGQRHIRIPPRPMLRDTQSGPRCDGSRGEPLDAVRRAAC